MITSDQVKKAITHLESRNNPGCSVSVSNISGTSADVKITKENAVIYEGRQNYPKEVIEGIVKKIS